MKDTTQLNDKYRAEGWGKITDEALGIEPADVEMQARTVARWAYEEIKRLRAENERLRAEQQKAAAYAENLAVSLARHYPENTVWKPLTGDLIGLLTQIDNATAGLVRLHDDEIGDDQYLVRSQMHNHTLPDGTVAASAPGPSHPVKDHGYE
jgi:hypothetical protein